MSEFGESLSGTVRVELTRGMFAVVDAIDLPLIAGRKWRVNASGSRKFYAVTGNRPKTVMHRLLLGVPSGVFVDHINGDTLDNRRCNLRPCTLAQNRANSGAIGGSSKYRGVSWKRREQRWCAQIIVAGRSYCLGYFKQEEDAARAYDAAFKKHYGDFARLNFPEAA